MRRNAKEWEHKGAGVQRSGSAKEREYQLMGGPKNKCDKRRMGKRMGKEKQKKKSK